jgi:signal recognition particle receptor subunit alpha
VFLTLYEPFLTALVASLHAKIVPALTSLSAAPQGISSWDFATAFASWDRTFDKILKGIENKVAQDRKARSRGGAGGFIATPPTNLLASPPSVDDEVTCLYISASVCLHAASESRILIKTDSFFGESTFSGSRRGT